MLTAMVAAIGAAATWLCALETLAELPFIGDQVVCLSHEPDRLCQSSVNQLSLQAA
jgi:hypothetical protein